MSNQTTVLDYWFGKLNEDGLPLTERNSMWFGYAEATDREIEHRFGELVQSALAGELSHWLEDEAGLIALVILLDQFTRNIFRGTPAAFSGDEAALATAETAISKGRDRAMPTIHRVFLYIPYEHSEDLEVQERGVVLFDDLLKELEVSAKSVVIDLVAGFQQYCVAHRDVISQFGRFPHRNEILGRATTVAEREYLERNGGF